MIKTKSATATIAAQSQIKAAEAAALMKAAKVVDCSCEWRNLVLGLKSENGRSRWDACGEANCDAITAQSILALISDDQQSALDAALLAAKEEGFWIGRSVGGSMGEINTAIRAMKDTPND